MAPYWTFGEAPSPELRLIRMVQAESREEAWRLLELPMMWSGTCPLRDLSTPGLLELLQAHPPGRVVEALWPETPTAYDRFRGAVRSELNAAEDEGYDFS